MLPPTTPYGKCLPPPLEPGAMVGRVGVTPMHTTTIMCHTGGVRVTYDEALLAYPTGRFYITKLW